ncbi:MAG: glycoside hydrolase family 26 protein [Nocardioidaceae bacterium]
MAVRRAFGVVCAAALLTLTGACQIDSKPAGNTARSSSALHPALPPGPSSSQTTSANPTATCRLSEKLVPSCGVLWGVAVSPSTYPTLLDVQRKVGRTFDLIYHYQDIVGPIPNGTERQEVGAGQILHISLAARIYGSAPKAVTYAGIAAGNYDTDLRRQAEGIASLKVPVFVTFEQEANQHRKLGVRGSAAQFRAAWRHVHQVYVDAGATNAVWVWVMTGDPANLARAATLWPGNDVVDWISWNVYNHAGCQSGVVNPDEYATFAEQLLPFYRWVHMTGPSIGMDPTKPMMISEAGSVRYPGNPGKTAGWYTQIPSVLKRLPQIKAIALWDSHSSPACDYRFQLDPPVLRTVTDVGHNSYLDAGTPPPAR